MIINKISKIAGKDQNQIVLATAAEYPIDRKKKTATNIVITSRYFILLNFDILYAVLNIVV